MSTHAHTTIVRQFHEHFNTGDLEGLAAFAAPEVRIHHGGADPMDWATAIAYARMFRAAFPDGRNTIEDLVAAGDRVAYRGTFRGTQRGPFQDVAPSGRAVAMPWLCIDRFAGGRIAERWVAQDTLRLLQQLGVMPADEPVIDAGPERTAAGQAEHAGDADPDVCRRIVSLVLDGEFDAAARLLTPDYVDHADPPGTPGGVAGAVGRWRMFRTAFPDLSISLDDVVAQGDRVATRFTVRGTHQGPLLELAPTGRAITLTGIDINRLVDGRIAERWAGMDMLGLQQQLGVGSTRT